MNKTTAFAAAACAAIVLPSGAYAAESFRVDAPASVLVDGASRPGAVTVSSDGRVRIASADPLSRVEIEWKVSFGPDAAVFGGDFERTYGDAAWRPVAGAADAPRGGAMAWYCLVSDAGRVDGYGVEVQPGAFAAWEVFPDRVRLSLDCRAGSDPVELGARTLDACRIVTRRGRAGESAFEAGRAFCRVMCPRPRLPSGPVYGYNDWYCAYGKNTAENFLADAAFIVSLVKGEEVRPYVVVDDGWQHGRQGSAPAKASERWKGVNEKWGMGMDEVARRVKAMDARPGLWYRPFLPDDGLPNEGVPMDPTDPGLEGRIRSDIKRFVEWGYEMVKIDFITYEWCGKWGMDFAKSPVVGDLPKWRDRSRTTAEVVRGLYAAMRDAAGDRALIIGCNAIDHFAAGLFELQRTGDDTSGEEWARTRKMGPNTLGMRAIHNDTFYRVDGDCFGLAKPGAIEWRLNSRWLDLLARSGTALFVSWRRELTTMEIREALEAALRRAAKAQPTGEPLDWTRNVRPARWRFGSEEREYDWE